VDELEPESVTITKRDAGLLIGVLAILETNILADALDDAVFRKVRQRLQRAGMLDHRADEREVRQALSNMNHRLRYALGEYDEPTTVRVVSRDEVERD